MGIIKNKKKNSNNMLLNTSLEKDILDNLIKIQNDVGVNFSSKIVGIASIDNDFLAATFARGYALAYSSNNLRTLIIDANMYNPILFKAFNKEDFSVEIYKNKEEQFLCVPTIDENISIISLNKEVYPSDIYKTGVIEKIIRSHEKDFDHFIVLTPCLEEHKEIVLLKEVLSAIILVVEKNVTKLEYIFNAIEYCKENQLPLAKTVILK